MINFAESTLPNHYDKNAGGLGRGKAWVHTRVGVMPFSLFFLFFSELIMTEVSEQSENPYPESPVPTSAPQVPVPVPGAGIERCRVPVPV